jgi:hypothetical protein
MGTWSAAIFGNDASCEVKEYFFERYNSGKEPADLGREVLETYAGSLEDKEEKYDILLALAYCLWQTKALDEQILSEIRRIVVDGLDLAGRKDLGADTKFLRERGKALSKLLADIETPRGAAKKRVKPRVPVDSVYRNGCCLAFQYENGEWGVAITVDCKFFKRKATLSYAQTDIRETFVPTMADVYKAHLLDRWFKTYRKLHLYGPFFLGMKEIGRLNPYNEGFFTIIGYLPEWKDASNSSSSGSIPYQQDSGEGFSRIVQHHFGFAFAERERTVETVEEINRLFADGNTET